jgi:hypothetical protein
MEPPDTVIAVTIPIRNTPPFHLQFVQKHGNGRNLATFLFNKFDSDREPALSSLGTRAELLFHVCFAAPANRLAIDHQYSGSIHSLSTLPILLSTPPKANPKQRHRLTN